MDIALLIRNRLKELGLGQRDLARAAHVTESYISQLLTQKKLPPAPNRSDMYETIGRALQLPQGQLANSPSSSVANSLGNGLETSRLPCFATCGN